MRRGNHAEIDIFPGHPVDNPLAGNVVDLCPVGALLDKDFLHKQRVWFLSKHDADLHPLLDRLQHLRRGEPWARSGGSSPGSTRTSTTTGSATRGATATRPPTTRPLLGAMYVRKDGDLRAAPVDRGAQRRRAVNSGGSLRRAVSSPACSRRS